MSSPILIVGEGRVGLSLAADLIDQGDVMVTVVGMSQDRPTFLRDLLGVAYLVTRVPEPSFGESLDEQIGATGRSVYPEIRGPPEAPPRDRKPNNGQIVTAESAADLV